jgi:CPA1 family monovalent cation:H+ antiporter
LAPGGKFFSAQGRLPLVDFFDILTILITLSAVFGYLNYRYIRLPPTIGLMLFALVLSLLLIAVGRTEAGIRDAVTQLLSRVDFHRLLLQGILSFLLFAGALHVNLDDLLEEKWVILSLSTVGVFLSTLLVGGLTWYILNLLQIRISLIHSLLFGALISPTDPIAVLGIFKKGGTGRKLEAQISGEALFNDGMGVVVFIVLLKLATGEQNLSFEEVLLLFLEEALGGVLFGFALGYFAYRVLKTIDYYKLEILITLAVTMGGYSLANTLHTSGPLAIVVAGLFVGKKGRALAMSTVTRQHLDAFWDLLDEILNAVLFILIGLEVIALEFTSQYVLAGMIILPIVLLCRLISVGIPVTILRRWAFFDPKTVRILTWAGLRGGIAVALALSIPIVPARSPILAITYMVVVFSVLVQGLTIDRLLRGNGPDRPSPGPAAD